MMYGGALCKEQSDSPDGSLTDAVSRRPPPAQPGVSQPLKAANLQGPAADGAASPPLDGTGSVRIQPLHP